VNRSEVLHTLDHARLRSTLLALGSHSFDLVLCAFDPGSCVFDLRSYFFDLRSCSLTSCCAPSPLFTFCLHSHHS
jgi:hypothetical protein